MPYHQRPWGHLRQVGFTVSIEPEQHWSLTRRSLDRLLHRLSDEPEVAAREYEAIRRRLITFFSLRRIHLPEAMADETIDRVARRLDEGESVEHVRAYFHGVAQRVALESIKRQRREWSALERQPSLPPLVVAEPPAEPTETQVSCLEHCLKCLPRESRALIVRYYQTSALSPREHRKRLAERLGISYTSLKVRAHRIRAQLEKCLQECLMAGKGRYR